MTMFLCPKKQSVSTAGQENVSPEQKHLPLKDEILALIYFVFRCMHNTNPVFPLIPKGYPQPFRNQRYLHT